MEVDEFEHLVLRALELGVPADLTAELFELPVDTATELLRTVRVRQYGTADLPEFIEGLQWRALEHADRMLRSGSVDQAAKIVTAVFGRQIQAAGRRPSTELEEARARITQMFSQAREGTKAPAAPGPGWRRGRFRSKLSDCSCGGPASACPSTPLSSCRTQMLRTSMHTS